MQRISDTPAGLRQLTQQGVEVKLWDIYVSRNRSHLKNALSAYSIDRGPSQKKQPDSERTFYRFTYDDWEKTIKPMLSQQSVPFEIVRDFKVDAARKVEKKKICIAEDDLDILFAINTMLEEAGYDVLLSHCGRPIIESNHPATDLFILDNRMPDVTGIDICGHLKSQSSTSHIPVIMISAVRNFGPQARRAGVDDYLEKPFQMQDLMRLVSKYTHSGK